MLDALKSKPVIIAVAIGLSVCMVFFGNNVVKNLGSVVIYAPQKIAVLAAQTPRGGTYQVEDVLMEIAADVCFGFLPWSQLIKLGINFADGQLKRSECVTTLDKLVYIVQVCFWFGMAPEDLAELDEDLGMNRG